jgi:hypothetical protein
MLISPAPMLTGPAPDPCECGHGGELHDRFGCAAFLGAFPATADERRYCACRRSRPQALTLPCLHVEGTIAALAFGRTRRALGRDYS